MNLVLFFYLLILSPKLLFRKNLYLFEKLFGLPPQPNKSKTIWIHAVSVGEVKAVQPLFNALLKKHPDSFFLITTTTATGQAEAKKSLSGADAYRFLPFDFSWLVRRWVNVLAPQLFFLVETDFWPNLLSEIQKAGGKTILVNGKMSASSFRKYSLISILAKKLFSHIDLLCVQNEEHRNRFLPFLTDLQKIKVTGNLKFDLEALPIDLSFWKKKLHLPDKIVVFASTHAPEEEEMLKAFPLDLYFLILVPRHPERFEAVAHLLSRKKIPFFRWTHLSQRTGGEKVLLVDAMGQIPLIYSLSRLAIVGGSYTDKVGGHNILEPSLYSTPVFFGPHMFKQTELASYLLASKAGKQIPLLEIPSAIHHFFNNSLEESAMRSAAQIFSSEKRGATLKTLSFIEENQKNLSINH